MNAMYCRRQVGILDGDSSSCSECWPAAGRVDRVLAHLQLGVYSGRQVAGGSGASQYPMPAVNTDPRRLTIEATVRSEARSAAPAGPDRAPIRGTINAH
jgi:hypothetical protein